MSNKLSHGLGTLALRSAFPHGSNAGPWFSFRCAQDVAQHRLEAGKDFARLFVQQLAISTPLIKLHQQAG